MQAHFETSGIYPLSVEPAEGYGSDPLTRTGEVVITHTNRKFIKLDKHGHTFVTDRNSATRFKGYAEATQAATDLIEQEKAKRAEPLAA